MLVPHPGARANSDVGREPWQPAFNHGRQAGGQVDEPLARKVGPCSCSALWIIHVSKRPFAAIPRLLVDPSASMRLNKGSLV